MVPRGLVVAVCVGMAAGAAATAALYGKGDAWTAGMPVSYVEGPSVSVAVERAEYRSGEPVRIRVVNTGTVPLVFADGSYGLRVTQLDGIEVYSPRPLGDVIPSAPDGGESGDGGGLARLGPREEAILVWNQTKTGGGPVLHGTYRIAAAAATAAPAAGDAAAGGAAAVAGTGQRIDTSVAINILR